MIQGARQSILNTEKRAPFVIERQSKGYSLWNLLSESSQEVERSLLEYGALLFRGFEVDSLEGFDRVVSAMNSERMDYVYGSTPRTALGGSIFTATEYPAPQEIPLHNESSYQHDWPLKLALCCLRPAEVGGDTPIADMREVTARVGKDLFDRFAERGVRYVRHYHPGIDVPWQTVFRTDRPEEVGRFCSENQIEYEWLPGQVLRTMQVCHGVAAHPVTGDRFVFNQAHLFHVSSVGEKGAQALIDCFGADQLPRQTFYGDGSQIAIEDLERLRAAFRESSISFPWLAGDVMLIDNMRMAHGRRPYKGTRKVIVALMDSIGSKRDAVKGCS